MQHDLHLPGRHRRVETSAGLDLAAVRALRSATTPDWSPTVAYGDARTVLEAAGGDPVLLRRARMQLIAGFPPSKSRIGGRAVLTLTFALDQAEDARAAVTRREA